MISHERKCIFIHIPKCAGTSIESALGHFDGYSGRERQDHRSLRMIEQPLLTLNAFFTRENIMEALRRLRHGFSKAANPRNSLSLTKEQYETYFKFTFVRNPWARAYSWYYNVMRDEIHQRVLKISGEIAFVDFLRRYAGKGMLKPQTYWLKGFNGSMPLDYIGRFETLGENFETVCKAMNVPRISLPHKTAGSSKNYREYYDDEAIDIIRDVYEEEIDMFEYSFGSTNSRANSSIDV